MVVSHSWTNSMFYLGTTVLNYLPLAFDDYSTSNPAKSTTFCYSIFPFCPKVHIICNWLALKLTACIYNNDYLLQPFVSSFFAIYPVFQIAEYNATIETLNLKMSDWSQFQTHCITTQSMDIMHSINCAQIYAINLT